MLRSILLMPKEKEGKGGRCGGVKDAEVVVGVGPLDWWGGGAEP